MVRPCKELSSSNTFGLIFIENVGNLVYPATFDLKTDLLPHFDFSMDEARCEALKLNPELRVFELSATTGHGLDAWLAYLRQQIRS